MSWRRVRGPARDRQEGDEMGTSYTWHVYERDTFNVDVFMGGRGLELRHVEDNALHSHAINLHLEPRHLAAILVALLADGGTVRALDDDGRRLLRDVMVAHAAPVPAMPDRELVGWFAGLSDAASMLGGAFGPPADWQGAYCLPSDEQGWYSLMCASCTWRPATTCTASTAAIEMARHNRTEHPGLMTTSHGSAGGES